MNQLHHRESNANRDRASLFAAPQLSSSGRSSPLPTHYPKHLSGYAANRTADDLEGQNAEHLEGLSAKVRMLKDITINIGNEVRDSTKMLSGMNDSFSETGGILGGTMRRMNQMAKRQGGQWCYWILFLAICSCVFFWTWVWRR